MQKHDEITFCLGKYDELHDTFFPSEADNSDRKNRSYFVMCLQRLYIYSC